MRNQDIGPVRPARLSFADLPRGQAVPASQYSGIDAGGPLVAASGPNRHRGLHGSGEH